MKELTIADSTYRIVELPGRPKALLDRSVADIYQVETKRINEAVERNPEKFPEGFYFQLSQAEVANCDLDWIDWKGGHLPRAFTLEGCNMLSTILKSPVATQRCIQIVKGFTLMEKAVAPTQSSENPLVAQARALLDMTQKWCAVQDEQKRLAEIQASQARRIELIEAKTEAAGNPDGGFFAITAWAVNNRLHIDRFTAARLGKIATEISRQRGVMTGQVPDSRWGHVKTYHESVLSEAFAQIDEFDTSAELFGR